MIIIDYPYDLKAEHESFNAVLYAIYVHEKKNNLKDALSSFSSTFVFFSLRLRRRSAHGTKFGTLLQTWKLNHRVFVLLSNTNIQVGTL